MCESGDNLSYSIRSYQELIGVKQVIMICIFDDGFFVATFAPIRYKKILRETQYSYVLFNYSQFSVD